MENCVYILYSASISKYYIGFTQNLDLRLEFHKNSDGRKFTAKAKDWKLFFRIDCNSKAQGLCIESHIKKMKSKKYIENLKQYPEMVYKLKKRYSDS
jgi:putative endonuclease